MTPRTTSPIRRAAALRQTLRRGRQSAGVRPHPAGTSEPSALGCTVLRRVSDPDGQQWIVRERRALDSTTTLVFQRAGRREETECRSSRKGIGEMWDGDLVALLRFGA